MNPCARGYLTGLIEYARTRPLWLQTLRDPSGAVLGWRVFKTVEGWRAAQ